ncbi:type II toxin-antitoxin system VapC family toxin [Jannaschia rubra]|uniref:type II toxin-antitoxin system VapC family toxin n=1 Tax=Jannaschia rubra TaxID=282197 RepID=UPI0024905B55|nr:type II toxin-antitoxin system VapC family toxin [Jannaschia rubra]
MRLLLDTQIVLWSVLDDPRLTPACRDALSDRAHALHVSAVSVWEVAIKTGLGKLRVPPELWEAVRGAGVSPLPITWAHARAVEGLPRLHADPFDRMLIAQARVEGMVLMSADAQIARYDVALFAG